MSDSTRGQRTFIRCRTCGAIMTARVMPDGAVVPVGVGNDCTCGDGEFELVNGPDAGAPGDRRQDESP